MKMAHFIIFFSIVLTIYGLVNYYIFIRGWQALPTGSRLRIWYLIIFLIIASSFILARMLERIWLSPISGIMDWIGSFWLAAMLYFFLIIVLLDLARLVNHWLPLFPSAIMQNYAKAKQITALMAFGIVALILLAGHINAIVPRVKTLNLTIAKTTNGLESLKIVAATDIHLGTIVNRSRLDNLVDRINALNPDLVLLPGDIVDEDIGPVIRDNLGEALVRIEAPLGVYAVTGNHEYIGGVEAACRYLTEHGVVMLRDSVAQVEGIYIVGREDRDKPRFSGLPRQPLAELMQAVDRTHPIILMDHQPFGLDDAASGGVDLQISGHTHHGQLWPFNLITNLVYEKSWGELKKGETLIYVSSGYGTWGPPVRTGNRPEIINIKLTFQTELAQNPTGYESE